MLLLLSADFFQNQHFQKNISGKLDITYTFVSIGLDPNQDRHFVGPDLGPTVCKGYQQTAKVAASKETVNCA